MPLVILILTRGSLARYVPSKLSHIQFKELIIIIFRVKRFIYTLKLYCFKRKLS